MKRIIVTIDEEGQAQVKTEGFTGKSCTAAADAVIAGARALGLGTDTKRIAYSSEYHAQETQQVRAGA